MIKLKNIILESANLYSIDVLIKTKNEVNLVDIYNQIRGLSYVVVVTVEQNQYLDSQSNDRFDFSLLHIKYLAYSDPKTDIDLIKKDALITTRIEGLLQFIPRYKTIQQKNKY